MGDDQDRAGIGAQMAFQPCHGFRIEMVGRLIKQQQIGLRQQELAQCHTAALTA